MEDDLDEDDSFSRLDLEAKIGAVWDDVVLAADVCSITSNEGRKLVENGGGDFSLDVQRARGMSL